jgi:hypothetical protein
MEVLQAFVNTIRSLSAALEVNPLAIIFIIALGIGIRAVEKERWLGRGGYVLITLVLGLIIGAFIPAAGTGFKGRVLSGFGHAGCASLAYQVALTILPGTKYVVRRKK